MNLSLLRVKIVSKLLTILLFAQLVIILLIYFFARTSYLWIWSTLSFIPATVACLFISKKWYTLLSLILFFVSQQAVFVFANPSWGLCFGSDAINDLHTASVIYEKANFELGRVSYVSRLSYSYYPMLHIFSSILSKISGISLTSIALYFVQFSNAILTAISLFFINQELFKAEEHVRNFAVLFFEMSFYYTAFHSQFIRETFAFPLVLLAIWIFARITKTKQRQYAVILTILVGAIILSHQMSSYLFFVIILIMAVSFSAFHGNKRLNISLFLVLVMLSTYTVFVVLSFSITQWTYALEGIQAIIYREGSHTILRSQPKTFLYLSLGHYVILSAFSIIGSLMLLREKKKDWTILILIAFFVFAFIVSTLLRLSTSADPWSWTYYMALRGTIWALLGISFIVAIGVIRLLKLKKFSKLKFLTLLIIICVLALGKFSQYPSIITDLRGTPITYSRFVAALWLKEETVHGTNFLVAPESDMSMFEASRCMAPYAYLKEYFLDETKGRVYSKFYGYIPFIGGFFDQYTNSSEVQIVYSNGETQIGYKK